MSGHALHHIGIIVEDMDAALGMFVGDLGLELIFANGEAGGPRIAMLRCGPVRLELTTSADPANPGAANCRIDHLAFRAEDFAATIGGLQAKGVGFTTDAPMDFGMGPMFSTVPETSQGVHLQFIGRPEKNL